jgi:hypothetical protein
LAGLSVLQVTNIAADYELPGSPGSIAVIGKYL